MDEYTMRHGECVAVGMACGGAHGRDYGRCDPALADCIEQVSRLDPPTRAPGFDGTR
ncbi:MAG: hypothetical protein R2851_28520 [Caldilineaceae bacterium]